MTPIFTNCCHFVKIQYLIDLNMNLSNMKLHIIIPTNFLKIVMFVIESPFFMKPGCLDVLFLP